MADRRRKNVNWSAAEDDGSVPTWERVQVCVLMDIRDELQALNRTLACPRFLGIPTRLANIEQNTRKPKPKRKRDPQAALFKQWRIGNG